MLGAFVMIDKILVVYNKINMFAYLCRGGGIVRRYKRIWHSALYRIRNPVVAIISVRIRSFALKKIQIKANLFG